MAKKLARKIECCYRIFKLSEDGLLKVPIVNPSYGIFEPVFSSYGYESMDKALEAIKEEQDDYNEYTILPFYKGKENEI